MASKELLCAALGAVMPNGWVCVPTRREYSMIVAQGYAAGGELNPAELQSFLFERGVLNSSFLSTQKHEEEVKGETKGTVETQLTVRSLGGVGFQVEVTAQELLAAVAARVAEKHGIAEKLSLFCCGQSLPLTKTVKETGLQPFDKLYFCLQNSLPNINCAVASQGPKKTNNGETDNIGTVFLLDHSALKPDQDTDFQSLNIGACEGECYVRGGEPYQRPCGWYRFAINVFDQFGEPGPDRNKWLRMDNHPQAWAVSYHGFGQNEDGLTMVKLGSKLAAAHQSYPFRYGFFTTYSVSQAAQFATEFDFQGSRYAVMFQSRVNPSTLQKVADGQFWASPGAHDIRSYGILIRRLS